jgi:hypothetical protein
MAPFSCVHLEATQNVVVAETTGQGAERVRRETGGRTVDVTLYRDRSRWRISYRNQLVDVNGVRRNAALYHDFCLGDQLVTVMRNDFDPALVPAPARTRDLLAQVRVNGELDGTAVDERQLWLTLGLSDVEVLFGHAVPLRSQPLWRVVRGAETLQLLPEMETVDEIPTHVIRSVAREGTRTMWLDPKEGCLPRRIEIHRLDDKVDFLYRYEKIRIERKEGVPVIVGFEAVTKGTYADGKESEFRREFRLRSIDFDRAAWPATAFQGSIEIPDGTPVIVKPAGAANYEWRDGRIRAKE